MDIRKAIKQLLGMKECYADYTEVCERIAEFERMKEAGIRVI